MTPLRFKGLTTHTTELFGADLWEKSRAQEAFWSRETPAASDCQEVFCVQTRTTTLLPPTHTSPAASLYTHDRRSRKLGSKRQSVWSTLPASFQSSETQLLTANSMSSAWLYSTVLPVLSTLQSLCTSTAAMAQGPCMLGDFKGVNQFEAKF